VFVCLRFTPQDFSIVLFLDGQTAKSDFTYSSSASMPMESRPNICATDEVVNVPENGSSTKLPGFELARTIRSRSAVGFWVGWFSYSSIRYLTRGMFQTLPGTFLLLYTVGTAFR